MRIPLKLTLLAAACIPLGACAYGGIGLGYDGGYGSPYGYYNQGYGSPYGGGYYGVGYSSGYGSPYGYGSGYGYGSRYGYGSPYGYGSGYGYGSPYSGWYDNYYYPGVGNYVYDRYRRPHNWTDAQRRYWNDRQTRVATGNTKITRPTKEDWSQFKQRRQDRNGARMQQRIQNRDSTYRRQQEN